MALDASQSWLGRTALFSGRLLVIAAAVVALVLLLARLYLIVLPVVVALLLSTLLLPPARWLAAHRIPRGLASLALVLLMLSILGVLMATLIPRIVREVTTASPNVQLGLERLLEWVTQAFPISRSQVNALLEGALQQARGNIGRISKGLLTGAVFAAEAVAGALLTLVLLFFFVKDGEKLAGWVLERVSPKRRETVRAVGRRAWESLSGYLRGILIVALVDALGIGIGLLVIGVPLALPLAILTFFGGFFPIIGATVAGMVAVVIALLGNGFVDALLTLGVVLAVQQLESNVLEPVVMGRAVPLHAVVVLLSITAGAVLYGVAGAFLAVPVAAVLSAAGNELRVRREANQLEAPVLAKPP